MFSPNFKYQFEVNIRVRQFMIIESKTDYVVCYLPRDLLSTLWHEIEGLNSINLIMSRFKWETDTRFRIVNEQNLDCLFELVPPSEPG